MIRAPNRSTIISYHPPHTHRTTTAHALRSRMLAAGQSVYWNKIFDRTISSDPTFVLLALLWYPLYAFDEALEALYIHICWLVRRGPISIYTAVSFRKRRNPASWPTRT